MLHKFKKLISLTLCFLLILQQSGLTQSIGVVDISKYLGSKPPVSSPGDTFRPLHLRSLSYETQANKFKLLLDKGDLKNVKKQELQDTTKNLLNYFFIGITLPNHAFWVNLRPDAEDNIIDSELAQTDLGRILLEADLQLKKDTAKYTSPEMPEGKEYWDRLYRKAGEIFGSQNITIPTLTRPWIVPDEIIIRETSGNAYIYKATLKVMLEQDYLKDSAVYNFDDPRLKTLNEYSSQLLRELIIPKLTRELNSSRRYAPLRQVYYSLIFAQWFKARFYGKGGLYSWLIDRRDFTGLTSKVSWSKTTYFKAYQKSFKDGEYNIQQPISTPYGQVLRTYISGGISFQADIIPKVSSPLKPGDSAVLGPTTIIGGNPVRGEFPLDLTSPQIAELKVKGGTPTEPANVVIEAQESSMSDVGRRTYEKAPDPFSGGASSPVSASSAIEGKRQAVKLSAWWGKRDILNNSKNQGTLEIGADDLMRDNLLTGGTVEIRHIYSILSAANPEISQRIAEVIARKVNEIEDLNKIDIDRETDSLMREFQGESLERDEVKMAFEKARKYKKVIRSEEKQLAYFQDSNRFLSLTHPLVSTLQDYLDKMAEPGLPRARILVAVDSKTPLAFSLGQTIVISLSLIAKLDTIDEIVAVLAHEQTHHEFNCRNNWTGDKVIRTWFDIYDIGLKGWAAQLLQELQADFVGRKLAQVNLNTLAITEMLGKVVDDPRSSDSTHLDLARRNAAVLITHAVKDYEAGRDLTKQNIPIPPDWKLSRIVSSLFERIFYQKFNHDFKEAVVQASPRILRWALKVFSSSGVFSSSRRWYSAKKLLYVMNHYISLIELEGQRQNWPAYQRDALVISHLILSLSPQNLDKVMWRLAIIPSLFKLDLSLYRIQKMIRQKATAIARQLYFEQDNDFLSSLIGQTHLDITVRLEEIIDLIDFVWGYSDIATLGIISIPKDKTYLTARVEFLKKLAQYLPEVKRKEWLNSQLSGIISRYYWRYWRWRKFLPTQKNISRFIEHLREANLKYAQELGLDARKLYEEMGGSWDSLKYRKGFYLTYGELMNRLFNVPIPKAPELPIKDFINILQRKDETAFLQYIDKYDAEASYAVSYLLKMTHIQARLRENARHWLVRLAVRYFPAIERYLGVEIDLDLNYRAADHKKIYLIFKDDPALSEWMFQVLLRYGSAAQSKIIQRVIWVLQIITLLPVPTLDERLRMVKTYMETDEAKKLLSFMSLNELRQATSALSGLFAFNVRSQTKVRMEGDAPVAYGDQQLALPLYQILKNKLLARITNATTLKEAEEAYDEIIAYSNNVYGARIQGQARIIGQSQFHNDWLAPANEAYFVYLENGLKFLRLDSKEAIDYYFAIDSLLFAGERKQALFKALSKRLIEELSNEDLRDFLLELADQRKLDPEVYAYFVRKRIKTEKQFLFFKEARDKYLDKAVSEGRADVGWLVLIDTVLDRCVIAKKKLSLREMFMPLRTEDYYASLFRAMMESGDSDVNLKKQLALPWFLGSLARGVFGGYDIEFVGRQLELSGEGRGDFTPFNEFIDLFYNASSAEKLAILQKMLLGPLGLLGTPRGKRLFVKILAQKLPREGQAAGLLKDILLASGRVVKSEDLFYLLAKPILTAFLKRPQPESPSIRIEKLAGQMRKDLAGWGFDFGGLKIDTSALLSDITGRKLRKKDFSRFLGKYADRLNPSVSREKVDALADSLSRQLETRLGEKTASSALLQLKRSKKDSLRLNTLEPIEIIIQACESLGSMGQRFLQVVGQYLPLSKEEQERFRDVYDSGQQQDKFIAFDTLLEAARKDPGVRRFAGEDLVSIDDRVGGGSIVTVFTTTVRNRDANGNRIEGTHKEVLKVRNPNAETFANKVYEMADKIIDELIRTRRKNRKNYKIAKHLLYDIWRWVIQDIRDATFLELDSKYEQAHLGWFASNGLAVRVAPALTPNNKDVKRETYVPGPTLNKLFKIKLSGKSLDELIAQENKKEEPDVEWREFLENLASERIGLEDILMMATVAWIEDFSRHLVEPVFKRDDGQDVYLLHSDMHFGNAIIHPDLKTVYPIDRNFYLQLNKGEVDFFRQILTADDGQGLEFLSAMIDYFLNLSENQDNLLNKGRFRGQRRRLLAIQIGVRIKRLKDVNPVFAVMEVLQGLEAKGIGIPLNFRIMFKNIISIQAMLRDAGAGEFTDYLKKGPDFFSRQTSSPMSDVGRPTYQGSDTSSAVEDEKGVGAFLSSNEKWPGLVSGEASSPIEKKEDKTDWQKRKTLKWLGIGAGIAAIGAGFVGLWEIFWDRWYERHYLRLAKEEPERVLESVHGLTFYGAEGFSKTAVQAIHKEEVIKTAVQTLVKSNPRKVLANASIFVDYPWARKIIETAAKERPDAAIEFLNDYLRYPWVKKLVETALVEAPSFLSKFISPNLYLPPQQFRELRELLSNSQIPAIKISLKIANSYYFDNTRTLALLHKFVFERLSLEEAFRIARNDREYLNVLMEIIIQPSPLGKFSVSQKLSQVALSLVQDINVLHDELDENIHFKSVANFNAQELYILMVYGEEEIWTSTFNGLFDRLIGRLRQEGLSGEGLLDKVGKNKFRTFIKLCASYNRLNEFLETIPDKSKQEQLLKDFIQGIDKLSSGEERLSHAVTVADTFGVIIVKADEDLLVFLQRQVKEEYLKAKREKRKEGIVLYGLLSGMFAKRAVLDAAWFREMSQRYKIADLTGLSSKSLFQQNNPHIQQYFFYNDEDKDGERSFNSLLAQYRDRAGWTIEEKESYIIIKSADKPEGDGLASDSQSHSLGKRIELYANRPEKEEEGQKEIEQLFKVRRLSPNTVVHRGHSFHAGKTIEKLSRAASIVYLGSCGGYNNISEVLFRTPQAHIFSTKGTGTMLVNDPLLRLLNEEILLGKDINWPQFWLKAEAELADNDDFQNYIPPHKNLGVLFLKAYRNYLAEGSETSIIGNNGRWNRIINAITSFSPFLGLVAVGGKLVSQNPEVSRREFFTLKGLFDKGSPRTVNIRRGSSLLAPVSKKDSGHFLSTEEKAPDPLSSGKDETVAVSSPITDLVITVVLASSPFLLLGGLFWWLSRGRDWWERRFSDKFEKYRLERFFKLLIKGRLKPAIEKVTLLPKYREDLRLFGLLDIQISGGYRIGLFGEGKVVIERYNPYHYNKFYIDFKDPQYRKLQDAILRLLKARTGNTFIFSLLQEIQEKINKPDRVYLDMRNWGYSNLDWLSIIFSKKFNQAISALSAANLTPEDADILSQVISEAFRRQKTTVPLPIKLSDEELKILNSSASRFGNRPLFQETLKLCIEWFLKKETVWPRALLETIKSKPEFVDTLVRFFSGDFSLTNIRLFVTNLDLLMDVFNPEIVAYTEDIKSVLGQLGVGANFFIPGLFDGSLNGAVKAYRDGIDKFLINIFNDNSLSSQLRMNLARYFSVEYISEVERAGVSEADSLVAKLIEFIKTSDNYEAAGYTSDVVANLYTHLSELRLPAECLTAMERVTSGNMDIANPLDLLANYLSLKKALQLSPARREITYADFYKFIQAAKEGREADEDIPEEHRRNLRGLVVEAFKVREKILEVQLRAQAQGRKVTVVGNLSYGGVALAPVTEEINGDTFIAGTEIPVWYTKVGSTESHNNEFVLPENLFNSQQLRFFIEKNPSVVIVDASDSVASPKRTSPHIPDGFKGYRNFFILLNYALYGEVKARAFLVDNNFVRGLLATPQAKALIAAIEGLHLKPRGPDGYEFHFSYERKSGPADKDEFLYLRVGKQKDTPAPKADISKINRPAAIFLQSAIHPEDIDPSIQNDFIEGKHTPAYFDDKDHFKEFYLSYEEGYGVVPSKRYTYLSRQLFREFMRIQGRGLAMRSATYGQVRPIETVVLDLDGTLANTDAILDSNTANILNNLLKEGKRAVIITDDIEANVDKRLRGLRPGQNLFIFSDGGTKGYSFNAVGDKFYFDDYNAKSKITVDTRKNILGLISSNFALGSWQLEDRVERISSDQRIDLRNVQDRTNFVKKSQSLLLAQGIPAKVYKVGKTSARVVLQHKEHALKFFLGEVKADRSKVAIVANSAHSYQIDRELLTCLPEGISVNVGGYSPSIGRENPNIVQYDRGGISATLRLLSNIELFGGLPENLIIPSAKGQPWLEDEPSETALASVSSPVSAPAKASSAMEKEQVSSSPLAEERKKRDLREPNYTPVVKADSSFRGVISSAARNESSSAAGHLENETEVQDFERSNASSSPVEPRSDSTPIEPETLMSDVDRIFIEPDLIIAKREYLKKVVEAPLLKACEIFYDKNIRTLTSSADKTDLEPLLKGRPAYAYIEVDYNVLSDENKQIADQLIKNGYDDIKIKMEGDEGENTVLILIPMTAKSTVGQISEKAVSMAKVFAKQKMTWVSYTLEEIRDLFDEPGKNIDYFIEVQHCYYDRQAQRFYLSQEHYTKANESISSPLAEKAGSALTEPKPSTNLRGSDGQAVSSPAERKVSWDGPRPGVNIAEKAESIVSDRDFLENSVKSVFPALKDFSTDEIESISLKNIGLGYGGHNKVFLVNLHLRDKPEGNGLASNKPEGDGAASDSRSHSQSHRRETGFVLKIAYGAGIDKFTGNIDKLSKLNNQSGMLKFVPKLGAVERKLKAWSEEFINGNGKNLEEHRKELEKENPEELLAIETEVIRTYYLFCQETGGYIKDPKASNFVAWKDRDGVWQVKIIDVGEYLRKRQSPAEWFSLFINEGKFSPQVIFAGILKAEGAEKARAYLLELGKSFPENYQLDIGLKKFMQANRLSESSSPAESSRSTGWPAVSAGLLGFIPWYNRRISFRIPEYEIKRNHNEIRENINEIADAIAKITNEDTGRIESSLGDFNIEEYLGGVGRLQGLLDNENITEEDLITAMFGFIWDIRHKSGDADYFNNHAAKTIREIFSDIFSDKNTGRIEDDPVKFAAEVFIRLVSAQPFHQGNHRLADFLLNLILLKNNYAPFYLTRGNIVEYYSLFNNVRLQERDIASPELIDKAAAFFKKHIKPRSGKAALASSPVAKSTQDIFNLNEAQVELIKNKIKDGNPTFKAEKRKSDEESANPPAESSSFLTINKERDLTVSAMLGDSSAVSISPQSSPAPSSSKPPPVGGIDLRALPISVQPPAGSRVGSPPRFNSLSSQAIGQSRLDSQWQEMERMLDADIIPSTERIREYLVIACKSQDCALRTEKTLKALAAVLRLQEAYSRPAEPALKELLILLESDKPPQELQLALKG